MCLAIPFFLGFVEGGSAFMKGDAMPPLLHGALEKFEAAYDAPTSALAHSLLAGMAIASDEEGLSSDYFSCEKDFSKACPEGWFELENGACHAPAAYEGACPRTINYKGMGPQEKFNACRESVFPCFGACTAQDFSRPCPKNWQRQKGFCFAPFDYNGPCVGKKSFAQIGDVDRRAWATACRAEWPCLQDSKVPMRVASLQNQWLNMDCVMSFTEDCPARWAKNVHGNCAAPPDVLAPRCGFVVHTASLNFVQKQHWANTCDAPWPCAN